MGWKDVLDIGIGVANLAANASTASTLQQAQSDKASDALVETIIKELRDGIFHYRQTAKAILDAEPTTARKITAGAMALLRLRLQTSKITPDVFGELPDKQFTEETTSLIQDNASRLLKQLSPDETTQVNAVIPAAFRLDDYNFFVASYDDVQRYRQALPVFQQLKPWQLNACVLIIALWLSFSACVLGGTWLIGNIIGDKTGVFSFLAAASLWAGALWFYFGRMRRGKEFVDARKVVEDVQKNVNLDRFSRLEEEFGADKAKVAGLQQQAGTLVQDFFGDQ
jgi:hypothetical protein